MSRLFKNKKTLYISLFILFILSLSIGYAFLTERLNINGNTKISKNSWIIYFDNVVESDGNVSTSNPATIITPDKVQVDFNVDLSKTQDTYEFTVDMVNDGSLDAQIDTIEKSALTLEQLKDLEYTITYSDGTSIQPCDVLEKNSRREIIVRVRLKENEKYQTVEEQNLDLSFVMNYIQYDKDKVCNNETNTYTLTIDPDGGLYNGSTERVVIENLTSGQKIKLDNAPTKEDYYFREWIKYNDDNYRTYYEEEINTITIIDKDAYIKADYRLAIGPHTLYIDPNGGVYEGTSEITKEENLASGKIVKLGAEPTKTGDNIDPETALFKGWNAVNDVDYNTNYNDRNNTVTIIDRDAKIVAEWGPAIVRVEDEEHNVIGHYASLQKGLDVAQPGYFVYLLADTEENPTNYYISSRGNNDSPITLDLGGHTVTGHLTNNDILILVNGTIENPNGIGCTNNGILTLGVNDDDISIDSVALIGKNTNGGVGLEQDGVFNFYDGYLEGYIGLDGIYDDIPSEHYAFVDHNDEKDCQKVYIIRRPDMAVAKTVLRGLTMFFFNLQDALNYSMATGNVIYAIRDFPAPYSLTIPEGETAIFDINGFNVETGFTITNNGTFTLKDSGKEEDATQKGELSTSVAVVNNGNLNIENIEISQTTSANVLSNTGNLKITKSKITALDGYVMEIVNGESLIMDSDTYLNSNGYALYLTNQEPFNITGGNIAGIYNKGNLTINEGTYVVSPSSQSDAIYNVADSGKTVTFTMNGGTLEAEKNGEAYGVYNSGSGTTKNVFNDGTIKLVGTNTYWTTKLSGVYGGNDIIVNNINMDISAKTESTSYGAIAFSNSKKIIINNGTFTLKNPGGAASVFNDSGYIDATIHNGTYEVESKFAFIAEGGKMTINNGNFNAVGTSNAQLFAEESQSIINDGMFNSSHSCMTIGGDEKVVNGGDFTCGTYGISNYNYSGTHQFTMNGGTIKSKDNTINLSQSYTRNVYIYGGSLISENSYGIYLNSGNHNVVINQDGINEVSIVGKTTGIYVGSGTVTVENATIKGETEYGIYNKNNLTIGTNNDVMTKISPVIIGNLYGVYIDGGTTNFYDGILKGKTSGYNGEIDGYPDAYEIFDDTEIVNETNYNVSYLIEQDNFLKVGDTEYNSLQRAINSIESSGTIEVIKNHSIKSETNFPTGKDITLDFKGYTLNINKQIINNGILTLTDTSDLKNGGINGVINDAINNSGQLTIDDGLYTTDKKCVIYNTKDLTMNGGTIKVDSDTDNYGIYNEEKNRISGSFTMTGGTIDVKGTGSSYGIYNYSFSKVHIVNGNIIVNALHTYGIFATYTETETIIDNINMILNASSTNKQYWGGGAVAINSCDTTINGGTFDLTANEGYSRVITEGNLTINGGTFNVNGYYAYVRGKSGSTGAKDVVNDGTINVIGSNYANAYYLYANVTINGGNLSSSHVCMDLYGTKTVNGGDITCGTVAFRGLDEAVNLNITGGTITSTNNNINLSNTANYKRNVNISGGRIISLNGTSIFSNSSYNIINIVPNETNTNVSTYPNIDGKINGILLEKGTLNVDKATIIGHDGYGIKTYDILNLGNVSNDVSQTQPVVQGNEYGLYIDSGVTSIYDGIYKGTTDGIYGFISGLADAQSIVKGSEIINSVDYVTNYLDEQENFVKVKETGTEYNSLQRAINAIETQGTIVVLADHEMKTDTNVPSTKNITIDFNDHTLVFYKQLVNEGILILTDDSDDASGGVSAHLDSPLNNKGTMTIASGNYTTTGNKLIYNNKDFIFNGGKVFIDSDNDETKYGIYDDSNSNKSITIDGGELSINSSGNIYGIYGGVYGNMNITINSGKINCNSINGFVRGIRTYDTTLNIQDVNVNLESSADSKSNDGGVAFLGYSSINTNIYGGTFELKAPTAYAMFSRITRSLTIHNGTFTISGYEAYLHESGSGDSSLVTVNGGNITVTGTNYALLVDGFKPAVINNGNLTSSHECLFLYYNKTINGGSLDCGTYGVSAGSKGGAVFTMTGGTLISNNNAINYSSNRYGYVANISGGTVKSKENNAVYCNDSGDKININPSEANIENNNVPIIDGYENGIYMNKGTVTLGKEDGIGNKDHLIVKGGIYGLNLVTGVTTNIYDGTLKGTTYGYNIDATINKIETGYYIHEDSEKIDNVDYVVNYLKPEVDIVKNVTKNKVYNNLQTAFDQVDVNDELELINDVQLFYSVTLPATVDTQLDMKGHSIKTTNMLINNGKLSLINSDTTNNSRFHTGVNINILDNYGTLNVDNIIFENTNNGNNKRAIYTEDTGTTTLNKVVITSANGVYTEAGGTTNINNSTITSIDTAIYDEGTTNVNGSTITSEKYGVYSYSNSNGEYVNSSITGNESSFYKYGRNSVQIIANTDLLVGYVYNNGGTVNITDGSVNNYIINSATMTINGTSITDVNPYDSHNGVNYTSINNTSDLTLTNVTYKVTSTNNGSLYTINNTGTLSLVGGTYDINRAINYYYCNTYGTCYHYVYGIYNTGNVNINGSKLKVYDSTGAANPYTDLRAINNLESGNVNIDNIDIDLSGGQQSTGIYVTTGDVTLKTGNVNVASKNAYGSIIENAAATLSIGVHDGSGTETADISKNDPLVKAIGTTEGIGIQKIDGLFNYYDGKLIGNTTPSKGAVSKSEYNYEMTTYYDDENDFEYCVLEYMKGTSNINNMAAIMNKVYYRTLNIAIDRAVDNSTIIVQKNAVENVVVPDDKAIILDLNNYTISGTITNNGTLTIKNGEITTTGTEYSTAVSNSGTLYIGVNDNTIVYENVLILGSSVGLQNNGTAMMYDGYIRGETPVQGNDVLTLDSYEVVNELIDGYDTVHVVLKS